MKHIKYLLLVLAMFVVSTDGFSRNGGDRLAVSVSHDGNSMYFMKSKNISDVVCDGIFSKTGKFDEETGKRI